MALKRSSELPDDEGTVFVTCVPDAPFQILGRRGPNRELCVGAQLFLPEEGGDWRDLCRKVNANMGPFEIVIGAEAENLIRAVIAARQ